MVAELAELCGHQVAGFVDRTPSGQNVCSEDDAHRGFASGELPFAAERFVPAIGDCRVRLELATRYADLLAAPLVHPRAWVSPSATLGAGTVVLPMGSVQTLAKVGVAVIVHGGVVVDHDAVIEDGVYLAPGAVVCGGGIVTRGTLLPAGSVVGKGERFG